MDKKLLHHDKEFGITQWFIPTDEGKKFVVHTSQNVTGIIEENRSSFNSVDEKANWKGDWHRIASIPLHTFFEMKKKGITDSKKKLSLWLNSPENRYFRTRPGRV